jgi:hypothetical protein
LGPSLGALDGHRRPRLHREARIILIDALVQISRGVRGAAPLAWDGAASRDEVRASYGVLLIA